MDDGSISWIETAEEEVDEAELEVALYSQIHFDPVVGNFPYNCNDFNPDFVKPSFHVGVKSFVSERLKKSTKKTTNTTNPAVYQLDFIGLSESNQGRAESTNETDKEGKNSLKNKRTTERVASENLTNDREVTRIHAKTSGGNDPSCSKSDQGLSDCDEENDAALLSALMAIEEPVEAPSSYSGNDQRDKTVKRNKDSAVNSSNSHNSSVICIDSDSSASEEVEDILPFTITNRPSKIHRPEESESKTDQEAAVFEKPQGNGKTKNDRKRAAKQKLPQRKKKNQKLEEFLRLSTAKESSEMCDLVFEKKRKLSKQEAAVQPRKPPVVLRRPPAVVVKYHQDSDTNTEYSDSEESHNGTPVKAAKRKKTLPILSKSIKQTAKKILVNDEMDLSSDLSGVCEVMPSEEVETTLTSLQNPINVNEWPKMSDKGRRVENDSDNNDGDINEENCQQDSSSGSSTSSDDVEVELYGKCKHQSGLDFNVIGGVDSLLKAPTKADSDGKWAIGNKDRFGTQSQGLLHRYFQPDKCRICQKEGHLAAACSQKKDIACILCGSRGHHFHKCPDAICFNCNAPGHRSADCTEPKHSWDDSCTRCKLLGHTKHVCPDLWRQFHLSTDLESKELVSLSGRERRNDRSSKMFCYNCGRKGHLGYECWRPRITQYVQVTYPFISKYLNKDLRQIKANAKQDLASNQEMEVEKNQKDHKGSKTATTKAVTERDSHRRSQNDAHEQRNGHKKASGNNVSKKNAESASDPGSSHEEVERLSIQVNKGGSASRKVSAVKQKTVEVKEREQRLERKRRKEQKISQEQEVDFDVERSEEGSSSDKVEKKKQKRAEAKGKKNKGREELKQMEEEQRKKRKQSKEPKETEEPNQSKKSKKKEKEKLKNREIFKQSKERKDREPSQRKERTGSPERRQSKEGTGSPEGRQNKEGTGSLEQRQSKEGTGSLERRQSKEGTGSPERRQSKEGTGRNEGVPSAERMQNIKRKQDEEKKQSEECKRVFESEIQEHDRRQFVSGNTVFRYQEPSEPKYSRKSEFWSQSNSRTSWDCDYGHDYDFSANSEEDEQECHFTNPGRKNSPRKAKSVAPNKSSRQAPPLVNVTAKSRKAKQREKMRLKKKEVYEYEDDEEEEEEEELLEDMRAHQVSRNMWWKEGNDEDDSESEDDFEVSPKKICGRNRLKKMKRKREKQAAASAFTIEIDNQDFIPLAKKSKREHHHFLPQSAGYDDDTDMPHNFFRQRPHPRSHPRHLHTSPDSFSGGVIPHPHRPCPCCHDSYSSNDRGGNLHGRYYNLRHPQQPNCFDRYEEDCEYPKGHRPHRHHQKQQQCQGGYVDDHPGSTGFHDHQHCSHREETYFSKYEENFICSTNSKRPRPGRRPNPGRSPRRRGKAHRF